MVDDIIKGIAARLYEFFGDGYRIYASELPQGFKAPSFWILELRTSQRLIVRNRYFRNYVFDIQYFPTCKDPEKEINNVSDKLMMALEYIKAGNNLIRGTDISYEIGDANVLHFSITYGVFVEKVLDREPNMEKLEQSQQVKE